MKKVGILGFAHGHVFSFAGEWMRDPALYNVTVTGAWDHDKERLSASLEKLPSGIKAFDSAKALLESDIDAVVVSSETAYHAELVEMAAQAKKDIILYKPISLTMKEADRIVCAVNENGVRLTMGWQMRTDPQNARMREIVQSGELGKACLFRRRHGLATHTWAGFENTWHVNPQMNRDIFADDSAHPINLMLWMFGMPESVMCEMSTMLNPKIPNDNAVCIFKYANGLIAEISLSFTTNAAEITTEIYLEKGSVQQYFGDAPATRIPRNEKNSRACLVQGRRFLLDGIRHSFARAARRTLKGSGRPDGRVLKRRIAHLHSGRGKRHASSRSFLLSFRKRRKTHRCKRQQGIRFIII